MVTNPAILGNEFNHLFIKSVREITEIFPPSALIARPINPAQPVFSVCEITVPDVRNIISSLKNSKAKDDMDWMNVLSNCVKNL